MKKIIKGIGVLDLTTATKESLNGVNEIKGVGCILLSENNPTLLEGVTQKGIGTTLTIPDFDKESFVMKTGVINLDASFFESSNKPITLMLTGVLVLQKDITPELIEEKLSTIYGAGIITCPKNLNGIINRKASNFSGNISSYQENMKTYTDDFKITNEFLSALDDNTSILMIGDADMLSDIDPELFKKKIKDIKYIGDIIAYERYRHLIATFTGQGDTQYIPDGFVYHEGNAELSETTCDMIDGESWYVQSTLYIKEDVTSEMLQEGIKALHCNRVICSRNLLGTIKKIAVNRPTILPYTNKVRQYTNNTISSAMLQYETEPIDIIVNGALIFDKDMTSEILNEKVVTINNFGSITCEPEMYPAIMDKVRENHGHIAPRSPSTDDEEEGIVLAKGAGYLKL
jgi:hypothetical protein